MGDHLPTIVTDAGGTAVFVWEEFFSGQVRNPHTRRAYAHAVRAFLTWAEGQVGGYLDQLAGGIPKHKLHLAALRRFFDALVLRRVVVLNPADAVRAARYQVVEGKTPEIGIDQARTLLRSIHVTYETATGPVP